MSDKFPLTPAGRDWMRKQLKKLKDVDRPANSKAIEIARGHGDLSENADYSAAKEEQGMIEVRIRELNAKIALAEVIDPITLSGEKVMFGATVTIEDEDGEEKTYTIVGDDEADLKLGRISISSPVARGLIGGHHAAPQAKVGDQRGHRARRGRHRIGSQIGRAAVPPLGADHPAGPVAALVHHDADAAPLEPVGRREPGDPGADDRYRRHVAASADASTSNSDSPWTAEVNAASKAEGGR